MPRKKQPVATLRANGSRHYRNDVLDEREAREPKIPPVSELPPPSYLPKSLADKFNKLAPILLRAGILTAVDADGLARYLIAEQNYLRATNRLTAAMNAGNTAEADKWSAIQDRFFRQCRAAGSDLGLTVTGRCSIVLPPGCTMEEAPGEEADLFGDNS